MSSLIKNANRSLEKPTGKRWRVSRVSAPRWLPLDAGVAMDYERELESRGQMVSLFLQDPEVQRLFKRKMAEMFAHPPPGSYAGSNGHGMENGGIFKTPP